MWSLLKKGYVPHRISIHLLQYVVTRSFSHLSKYFSVALSSHSYFHSQAFFTTLLWVRKQKKREENLEGEFTTQNQKLTVDPTWTSLALQCSFKGVHLVWTNWIRTNSISCQYVRFAKWIQLLMRSQVSCLKFEDSWQDTQTVTDENDKLSLFTRPT